MKCQRCAKPATFHITDIERGKPGNSTSATNARQHLAPGRGRRAGADQQAWPRSSIGLVFAREPRTDKQVCPICQISFLEFRNSGRLGCPYDYEVFRDELMPLLENIHEETRHCGKVPRRAPRNTQPHETELIQLRNELKRAVAAEDYEAGGEDPGQDQGDRAGTGTLTGQTDRFREFRWSRSPR